MVLVYVRDHNYPLIKAALDDAADDIRAAEGIIIGKRVSQDVKVDNTPPPETTTSRRVSAPPCVLFGGAIRIAVFQFYSGTYAIHDVPGAGHTGDGGRLAA